LANILGFMMNREEKER